MPGMTILPRRHNSRTDSGEYSIYITLKPPLATTLDHVLSIEILAVASYSRSGEVSELLQLRDNKACILAACAWPTMQAACPRQLIMLALK